MRRKRQNNNTGKRLEYYLIYSVLFLIMCWVMFHYFREVGASFVWKKDGFNQHFRALSYYSDWLQNIVKNLIYKHRLIIPMWSASIGYGSDIISTLHYYVIGDPLALFSVFVPNKYMVDFYDLLILLRMYLAGMAFAGYCFYMKNKNKIAVLTGSFIYVFCGYTIMFGLNHPYFLNPMIYLPLLLIGVEKIFKKESAIFFSIMVFISCTSNFYFFYIIVLVTILYVIFRIFMYYRKEQWKEAIRMLVRMGSYAVLGVCMSAFILIPVMHLFLGGSRTSDGYQYDLLYDWSYYKKLPTALLTMSKPGNLLTLGYASIVIIGIVLLFLTRKKYGAVKFAFLVMSAFMLFPFIGRVFNGFSYAANRWTFAYGMLLAYIVVLMWQELCQITKGKALILCFTLIVYWAVLYKIRLESSMKSEAMLTLWLAVGITLLAIVFSMDKMKKWSVAFQVLVFVCVFSNIGLNGYTYFSNKTYVKEKHLKGNSANTSFEKKKHSKENIVNKAYVKKERLRKSEEEIDTVIKQNVKDKDFYRYSASMDAIVRNSTLQSGLHSTSYFWSLDNSRIVQYLKEIDINFNNDHRYFNWDQRTALEAIAGVKYYVNCVQRSGEVPYGYIPLKNQKNKNKYIIYKNQNYLPFGYTYDSYISKKSFDKMQPYEKQNAVLSAAVLEKNLSDYKKTDIRSDGKQINYILSCSDGIQQKGKMFIVKKKHSQITLSFSGMKNTETYLLFKNINVKNLASKKEKVDKEGIAKLILTSKDEKNTIRKNKLIYYTARNKNYCGRHDFLFNFGYGESAKKTITIYFTRPGTYSFDDISVYCQPMDQYNQQINALKENTLQNVSFKTNKISGNIALNKKKILCLSIPYSTGWTAYVDGKKTEILPANTMFMALPLSEGNHSIVLKYCTPGLKAGLVISLVGLILCIILSRYEKKFTI